MPSKKQIDDLRKATPRALAIPSTCVIDDDPRKGVRRWLAPNGAADSCDELDAIYEGDERLHQHPELRALWWLNLAERQARAKLLPAEAARAMTTPEVDPVLVKAGRLHRSTVRLETKTRLEQCAISAAMDELLTELEQVDEHRRQIISQLWSHHQSLKQIQYRMVDPAVVAGYFHDPHVSIDGSGKSASNRSGKSAAPKKERDRA